MTKTKKKSVVPPEAQAEFAASLDTYEVQLRQKLDAHFGLDAMQKAFEVNGSKVRNVDLGRHHRHIGRLA